VVAWVPPDADLRMIRGEVLAETDAERHHPLALGFRRAPAEDDHGRAAEHGQVRSDVWGVGNEAWVVQWQAQVGVVQRRGSVQAHESPAWTRCREVQRQPPAEGVSNDDRVAKPEAGNEALRVEAGMTGW